MFTPIFKPGDQKVFAQQGDLSASSHRIRRAYLVIILGTVVLGIFCMSVDEWLAGAMLTVIGLTVTVWMLKADVSKRRMLRRMRQRSTDKKP
jgi:type IV secretory pathway TrbD component